MASWANISCIFYLEKRFAQFCEEIPEVWWRLLTTSAPLCFIRMHLICFYVFNIDYDYLTVWNSHLYFVPAVRLSLWVHRVWRTGRTMESGSSKQSWDMHRPPRSSPGHSVQWVFFSFISFYSCHFLITCVHCRVVHTAVTHITVPSALCSFSSSQPSPVMRESF